MPECLKECPFEAIEMRGNLAYIDPAKCKACGKCVEVCPRGSIHAVNFPPRKPKTEQTTEAPKVQEAPKPQEAPKVEKS
jgi:Uncharacterized Fe-S center protein